MTRLNDEHRETYAAHASPESIRALLTAERAERRRVDRRIAWLEDLLVQRSREVEAGAWPAKATDSEMGR